MANLKIFVFVTFAALVYANEGEDVEQKKRGAGKGTSLNTIPTGAQKPEYTYSIYSQNPAQNTQTSYQTQVPNSFYPTQSGSSQYYQNPPDQASVYPQQPQLNLLPPPNSSPFGPLNFIPNAGYQTKYQIIPSKSPNGNIQLAILQPQSYLQQPQLQYPQSLYPSPSNHLSGQPSPILNSISPAGQFPNYQLNQPYQPYLGQPSTMLLLQPNLPNPSLYNNLLYPNAGPSLYNYYQPSPQTKYNLVYGPSSQTSQPQPPTEYDKLPAGVQAQALPKEDNEISVHNSDYLTPAESNANYKNYATSRASYKN